MAQKFNITIDQGSTFKASITVFDLQNDPFDITSFDITGQIRKYYDSANSIVTFTTAKTNAAAGIFTIALTPTQTANIEPDSYVYDVQISDSTDVYRVVEGVVRVTPAVTSNT